MSKPIDMRLKLNNNLQVILDAKLSSHLNLTIKLRLWTKLWTDMWSNINLKVYTFLYCQIRNVLIWDVKKRK